MRRIHLIPYFLIASFDARLSAAAAGIGPSFTQFFPEYSEVLKYIIEQPSLCGPALERYREDLAQGSQSKSRRHETDQEDDTDPELEHLLSMIRTPYPQSFLVNCMLEKAPEVMKVRMASAQVLLGLAPTVLTALAPEPWQAGAIAIIGRSPVLALLLAMGSPTLSPSFTSGAGLQAALLQRGGESLGGNQQFEYPAWVKSFMHGSNENDITKYGRLLRMAARVGSYALGMGAVANIGHLLWQLITHTVLAFTTTDTLFFFTIWVVLGVVLHGIGALSIWLRVKNCDLATGPSADDFSTREHTPPQSSKKRCSKPRKDAFEVLPPGIVSLILTWIIVVYAVVHIILGTVIFSSILFISARDGAAVVMRLLASHFFCRLAMEFEVNMALRDRPIMLARPREDHRQAIEDNVHLDDEFGMTTSHAGTRTSRNS